MAGSFETPSVQEQTGQSSLLTIKPHQNLILDLDPLKYDSFMLSIVEFSKYSLLFKALNMFKIFPMSLLSRAYSSSCCIKEEKRSVFEVLDKKTSITKAQFFSLLGLEQTVDIVDPDSITIAAIMEMFY